MNDYEQVLGGQKGLDMFEEQKTSLGESREIFVF
jgi:hypothetical protein